jgi:hypothetical protein
MVERPISDDATYRIGVLLDSIERVLKREQEDADAAAKRKGEEVVVFPKLTPEQRMRFMEIGCSVEDLNFWIRREDQDGGRWHILQEIETGYEVGAVDARDCCEQYFKDMGGERA